MIEISIKNFYETKGKEGIFKIKNDSISNNIIIKDGDVFYYKNGKCHREDGPAKIAVSGNKYWRINGKLHRLDGPAIEIVEEDSEILVRLQFREVFWIDGKSFDNEDDYKTAAYLYKNQLGNYL